MCPCNVLPAGVTVHVRHFLGPQLTEINEHKQFLCRRITEGWVREWEGSKRIPKANPPKSVFQGNLTLFKEFGSVILCSLHWILTTFISSTLLHHRKKQGRKQEWAQAAKCSCGSRPSRGGTELSTHIRPDKERVPGLLLHFKSYSTIPGFWVTLTAIKDF